MRVLSWILLALNAMWTVRLSWSIFVGPRIFEPLLGSILAVIVSSVLLLLFIELRRTQGDG
jgi:hypothetical protein